MPCSLRWIEYQTGAADFQTRALSVTHLLAGGSNVAFLPASFAGELMHRFHHEQQSRRAFPGRLVEIPTIGRRRSVTRYAPLMRVEHVHNFCEFRDQLRSLGRFSQTVLEITPHSVKPWASLII